MNNFRFEAQALGRAAWYSARVGRARRLPMPWKKAIMSCHCQNVAKQGVADCRM